MKSIKEERKTWMIAFGILFLVLTAAVTIRDEMHTGVLIDDPDSFDRTLVVTDTVEAEPEEQCSYLVNINTATAEEMDMLLPGIGDNLAEAIVEYREEHGSFHKVEDIIKVKGIGEVTYSMMREYCTVSGPRFMSTGDGVSDADAGYSAG